MCLLHVRQMCTAEPVELHEHCAMCEAGTLNKACCEQTEQEKYMNCCIIAILPDCSAAPVHYESD